MARTVVAFLVVVAIFTSPPPAESQDRSLKRPAMGFDVVSLRDVRTTTFKGMLPPTRTGAVVYRVSEYSPASDAKLKAGDIIVLFNKKAIKTREDLNAAKKMVSVGDTVEIKVHRFFRLRTGKKRITWRRGEVKLKVVSFGDYVKNQITTKTDDITGTTIYKHKGSPKYLNERSEFQVYYVKSKSGKLTPRIRILYVAKDWLFCSKYIVKTGGETFTITAGQTEVERDSGGGKIWEWFDKPVGVNEFKMLSAMIKADSITLRYEGKQYQKDRKIEDAEKDRIISVLTAYQMADGK